MRWLVGAELFSSASVLVALNYVFGSGEAEFSARTHCFSMFSTWELEGLQAVLSCPPDLRLINSSLRKCQTKRVAAGFAAPFLRSSVVVSSFPHIVPTSNCCFRLPPIRFVGA